MRGECEQEKASLVIVSGNSTARGYIDDDILRQTVLPFLRTAATWYHLSARQPHTTRIGSFGSFGYFNKGRGMCYPVYGMVHLKEPLLLTG